MTETEWLAHDDPVPMLEYVAGRTSERKLRLFLCACCARVLEGAARPQDRGADRRIACLPWLESALRTVVAFADGMCSAYALESARRAAVEAEYTPAYIDYGGESGLDDEVSVVQGAAASQMTPEVVIGVYRRALATLRKHRPHGEHERDLAHSLRDVVGNPFRPVAADPAWLSPGGNVATVAEGIYASGSFGELPFLADALEDAGCADADLLGHCRGPGPHVRGCWVLDLFIAAPRHFARAAAAREFDQKNAPAAVEPPPAPPRPALRPGDWVCPGCQAHNFARRDACLRCNRARPNPRLREGDWICPGCNAHNFARRQSCHQCKGIRPS